MSCDALPDGFKGPILNCDGTLIETLAGHVQAFQPMPRLYGPDVSAAWCRSKYDQPNLHVLQTCPQDIAPLSASPDEDSRAGAWGV